MNVGSELHTILDRRYRQEAQELLPEQSSADIAVYAALWLLVRCGGAIDRSCLKRFFEGESGVVGQPADLPALCMAGFRLNAGMGTLSSAERIDVESALQRVLRRKPHTEELSGPADDPLSLLGLVLLAEVVAPQLVEALRSWADGAAVSPSLRAAFILGGIKAFQNEVQLDNRSPSSLGAYLLITVADGELGHSLFPATQSSDVVSLFATIELDSLQPGSFDALAVLVSLEVLLQSHERVPARGRGEVSVLLVFANPVGTDPLRLGAEERALREAIDLSTNRGRVGIKTLQAATIDDLRRALLRDSYDIVHFSGHGNTSGLGFETAEGELEVPESQALAKLLHRRGIKTLLLNACDSRSVGLVMSLLDYTIAMDGSLSDKSAIEFSRGFYDAIGEGRLIPEAFDEGDSSCKLKGLVTPAVLFRKGDKRNTEIALRRSGLPRTEAAT